jgi:rhodanese-related sulfurtransferase
MFKEITPKELQNLDNDYLLLDVRRPDEVALGILPDARHIILDELPARVDELPKGKPMVVYCAKGGRSAQACTFLAAKGFKELYNLAGGIEAWLKEGGEVVKAQ